MNSFPFTILTAESVVFEGAVESVFLRAVDGELGILAGHVPLATAMAPGIVRVRIRGAMTYFVAADAVLDVSRERVKLLADHAQPAADWREATGKLRLLLDWYQAAKGAGLQPRDGEPE